MTDEQTPKGEEEERQGPADEENECEHRADEQIYGSEPGPAAEQEAPRWAHRPVPYRFPFVHSFIIWTARTKGANRLRRVEVGLPSLWTPVYRAHDGFGIE